MKRRSRKAWCMSVCGGGGGFPNDRCMVQLNPGENTMCGCTSGGGEVGSARTLFEYPQIAQCIGAWQQVQVLKTADIY